MRDPGCAVTVDSDHGATLSADGQTPVEILSGDWIEARAGEYNATLVRFQDPGYFYRNLTARSDPEFLTRSRCMTEQTMVCANHPDRSTTLRCNRCEKPICTSCAVLTPVGYRCRECVKGQQAVFETATSLDYVLAFVIAAVGSAMATALLNFIGFWGIFVAPVIGGALAEAIRYAVRRRRGFRLPITAAIGTIVGVLLNLVVPVFNAILMFTSGFGINLLAAVGLELVWPIVYGGLMASAIYYRLRGIRM